MAPPKGTRICKECGREFQPKSSRSLYCYQPHYRNCVWCGKQVKIDVGKLSCRKHTYCSNECMRKYIHSVSLGSSQVKERYTKICEVCGAEFTTSHAKQRVCNGVHYLTCSVCGQIFIAERWQLLSNSHSCSAACGAKLAHITYDAKYNKITNPEAHQQLIKKQEQTMIARYGYRNALCKEGKESLNISQRMIDKYGVDHPMKSKYIKDKRNNTNMQRYGYKSPLCNPEIRAKSQSTLIAKYGADNYAKTENFLKQVITDPDKAVNCKAFRDDPESFINNKFPDHSPTLRELSDVCGIIDSSAGYILDLANCRHLVTYTYSRMEDELHDFLVSELGQSANIERNTFKVITPYELDLYLPDFNLGIECNPTVTHNSTLPGWSINDEPKSVNYHKMKSDLCESKGVFLFHIFGYEWTYKKHIIKSMLRNLINNTPNKVYARKTDIKLVSDIDAMNFLTQNHRQGGVHSKIRLGLFSNNELVSLMTFSNMRPTIGKVSSNSDKCFELVRFCNKLDTNVVGGASKLFNYFKKHYSPEEIRSFSDRAHTKGSLYSKLGFIYDHTTDPGYMWVDLKTDVGYSRNNAQKSNIKKFLNDDNIDLNKTEVEIMSEHNFVQVYDSGVKLWIWRNQK